MSYKPDNNTLLAYLYRELSATEREKVQAYLDNNLSAQKEMAELQKTKTILGKLPDREVSAPTFIFDRDEVVVVKNNIASNSLLKVAMGIAASIVIIILTGYFTNVRITYRDKMLSIGYGDTTPNNPPERSEDTIKELIQQVVSENNNELLGKIREVEENMLVQLNEQKRERASTINTLLAKTQEINNNVIQRYVSQMQEENRKVIESLFTLSNDQQQRLLNNVLTDFSQYLENQRQNDLRLIQTSFKGLKDNTEINLMETNQVLASIITTVNNNQNN